MNLGAFAYILQPKLRFDIMTNFAKIYAIFGRGNTVSKVRLKVAYDA